MLPRQDARQALECPQPNLPLRQGHIRTEFREPIRCGTVALSAPLSHLDGKLIPWTERKLPPVEWFGFLKQPGRETPKAQRPT